MDAPPPPPTTAKGSPRTPSTPGRKPGTKNSAVKEAPAPRPSANRPPPPGGRRVARKNFKPAVEKIVKKLGSSLLIGARKTGNAALAADAIFLLETRDDWATCLDELAQDTKWLQVVLEKAAVIAPGVELASLAMGLVAQVAVNHGMVPLEMASLLDARDPRELLAKSGLVTVEEPAV